MQPCRHSWDDFKSISSANERKVTQIKAKALIRFAIADVHGQKHLRLFPFICGQTAFKFLQAPTGLEPSMRFNPNISQERFI